MISPTISLFLRTAPEDACPVRFFKQHWFLAALLAVIVAGWFGAAAIRPAADAAWLRNGLVALVLFLMALPLVPAGIVHSLRSPTAGLLAIAINAAFLPLVSAAGLWLLPRSMAAGLIVAAIVPCTLASASVWTRRGGGDDSVAMLVTVVTNALCFLVVPFWFGLLLGGTVEISAGDQIGKLLLLVVLPMALAQLVRLARPIGRWATARKAHLSTIAQIGILVMVLFGMVQMRTRVESTDGSGLTLSSITLLIAATGGLHTIALLFGWSSSGALRLGRDQRIAVAIAGSQKTLMVGLQIAIDAGVSILPMIAYHVGQLIIDTLFVDHWRKRGEEAGEAPSDPYREA